MDNEFNLIIGDSVTLELVNYSNEENSLPFYLFNVVLNAAKKSIGKLKIIIGEDISSSYQGNIYVEIDEDWQGHRYSIAAICETFKVFRKHNVDKIYLGCDMNNLAARRIFELMGAEFLEESIKPDDCKLDDSQIEVYAVYSFEIPEENYLDTVRDEHSSMAVVFYNDRVLTLTSTYNNRLVLPKGHIEEGESSIAAAIRECYEESGVLLIKEDHVKEVEPIEYSFDGSTCNNMTDLQFYQTFGVCKIHKIVDVHLFKVDEKLIPHITEVENFSKAEWMKIDDFLLKTPYESNIQAITNCLGVITHD